MAPYIPSFFIFCNFHLAIFKPNPFWKNITTLALKGSKIDSKRRKNLDNAAKELQKGTKNLVDIAAKNYSHETVTRRFADFMSSV